MWPSCGGETLTCEPGTARPNQPRTGIAPSEQCSSQNTEDVGSTDRKTTSTFVGKGLWQCYPAATRSMGWIACSVVEGSVQCRRAKLKYIDAPATAALMPDASGSRGFRKVPEPQDRSRVDHALCRGRALWVALAQRSWRFVCHVAVVPRRLSSRQPPGVRTKAILRFLRTGITHRAPRRGSARVGGHPAGKRHLAPMRVQGQAIPMHGRQGLAAFFPQLAPRNASSGADRGSMARGCELQP